ncbi:MAG: tyrosine-type recombinase/integrase [Nitrospinae bacterium]|nr:tyrosine-type recombinase/integrase [Nitrospinota bacterium]
MVQRGVDIYAVKELMGHKDIRLTQRYAHLSPEKLRRDICVLDGLMTQNYPNGFSQEAKKGVSH